MRAFGILVVAVAVIGAVNMLCSVADTQLASAPPSKPQPSKTLNKTSLDQWREAEARKSLRYPEENTAILNVAALPVTEERLAYEQELFSGRQKERLGGAKPSSSPASKLASNPATEPKTALNAMAKAVDIKVASRPDKPKRKKVARPRLPIGYAQQQQFRWPSFF